MYSNYYRDTQLFYSKIEQTSKTIKSRKSVDSNHYLMCKDSDICSISMTFEQKRN
jgi:hypothetical protein